MNLITQIRQPVYLKTENVTLFYSKRQGHKRIFGFIANELTELKRNIE